MLKPAQYAAALLALSLAGPAALAQTSQPAGEDATATQAASEAPAEQTAAEQTAPAPEFAADTVVVTVGGTSITLGEVIAVRRALPEQYQQLPDEVLMAALVQQLADQQLLANAAEQAGLRSSITVQLALRNQERSVMADAYMADQLIARVDEAAVQAAYDERFANVEPVQEVRAAHILVEEETLAADLKRQIDEGADFAALAAEHGTDGTASRGGDLGWFSHEQMVPEFADAAFALEAGTVSDPVQSPFGWHLIKLEEKRDQPIPTLDLVREELIADLTDTAQRALLEELRAANAPVPPEVPVPDSAVREDSLIEQ